MSKYLALHISGFEKIVKEALYKKFSDVKVLEQTNGLVVYETEAPIGKVNHIGIFSNIFIFIKSFKKMSEHELFTQLTTTPLDKNLSNISVGDSFRIVFSDEGKTTTIQPALLAKLETHVSKQLNLTIDRANPYWEFWIMKRSNGSVYFCLRLTYHPSYDKILHPGELRRDLSTLLAYVSNPQKSDVFLDPFCGFGSIPIARASIGKFEHIYAFDIDSKRITKLTEKFQTDNLQHKQDGQHRSEKSSFTAHFRDNKATRKIQDVTFKNVDLLKNIPLPDHSINKIVTDPPWGEFDKNLEGLDGLYKKFLEESKRLLRKDGILVVMLNRESQLPRMFESYGFEVVMSFDILVSGKKATVYKLVI